MNALICVGCDKYDFFSLLTGAERDARQMFDVLRDRGFYHNDHSALLLSPSREEVRRAIALELRKAKLSVLTFFFAGHAGGKNGSFFLGLRDSEPEALSTTAFPLAHLFEMVNEFCPAQVNIIIDACDAGCSTGSLHTLLRSEETGSIRASSIAFLGACAAKQAAGETSEGGILTRKFLDIIRGDCGFLTSKTCIDLPEIAPRISELVSKENPDQLPIWWGLNLFGCGSLMYNPALHLDTPLPPISLSSVDPLSLMGQRLIEFSPDLWDEYRAISKNFDPRRLNLLLDRLLSPPSITTSEKVKAVAGLLTSFRSVAADEGELLAPQLCSGTCLTSLLPWSDDGTVRDLVRVQLETDFIQYNEILSRLMDEMRLDSSRLLAHNGVLADVFYLPVRISQLLGLIGSVSLIGKLLNLESEKSRHLHKEIVQYVVSTYTSQLMALDDEQASPIYIFIKAAVYFNWIEEAQVVIQNLYADAAKKGGKFKRVNSGGRSALEHLLQTSKSHFASKAYFPARPSSLLAVILISGVWLQCHQDWDLRAFDRQEIGLFLPEDFGDFSHHLINKGLTHTWTVGFDVWNAPEIETSFRDIIGSHTADYQLHPETHCLCLLAALLFPDRVPLSLEFLS